MKNKLLKIVVFGWTLKLLLMSPLIGHCPTRCNNYAESKNQKDYLSPEYIQYDTTNLKKYFSLKDL